MCLHILKKDELIVKIRTSTVLHNDKKELQIWVLRTCDKKAGLDGVLAGILESSVSTEHCGESGGTGGIIICVE